MKEYLISLKIINNKKKSIQINIKKIKIMKMI
jgi:hypothetical protein